MRRARSAQLVHTASYTIGITGRSQSVLGPHHAVSGAAPLKPTPEDRTFAYATTLRCTECDEEFRVGVVNRAALLRRHRANLRLWLYAANSIPLAILFGWLLGPLLLADISAGNPLWILPRLLFLFLCAIPVMVVSADLRALRTTMVKAGTEDEVADRVHSWIWRPTT